MQFDAVSNSECVVLERDLSSIGLLLTVLVMKSPRGVFRLTFSSVSCILSVREFASIREIEFATTEMELFRIISASRLTM